MLIKSVSDIRAVFGRRLTVAVAVAAAETAAVLDISARNRPTDRLIETMVAGE